MKASNKLKRMCSLMLALAMVLSMLPVNVFAAQADATLTASLAEAKSYIDGITINNSSNDPATVVKNFKTHFTWDNEKRENSKSYLFDWSYYNGVVFEGIEYVYEVTGESVYADYVIEYMSSLITSSGGWATCTNSGYTSKQCAGYNSTHGADCYKTASLLLDTYEMTGDSRYLTMAKTLYADLDSAANSYSLSNAGYNYRHTWASDPSPDLWLDGLYMILPFRAEYAKYIGDTEELDLIVSRMQWVSDNMYNSSKGLFYHAADSASSNSGTYWLRSIGWYAAAIVDIMDSMEGENLEAMKQQLVKLVDGMKACQNSSNGMWLNNMNASQSSSNPYETSGTALTCYAVMKAVNKGWLDESYADMAILAFNGICNEKLSGSTLTDICFKGAPGSSNSTFYDNEGKGVGPFIMFYAEVLKYVNTEDEVPEETEPEETEPEETEPEETVPEETEPEETVPGEAVSVQGSGNLVGSTVYTLDSDGVNSGEKYLIVYSKKALQNNNGVDANPAVTISNNTITLADDSQLAWTITQSGSNYYVENNGSYVNLTASGNDPIGSSATVYITRSGSTYKFRNTSSSGAYLRYSNSQLFCAGTSSSNNSMSLYRRTSSGTGSAVTFAVNADTNTIKPGQTLALNGTVTVGGSTVDLSSCTITWSSSNTAVATVSGGTVTGVAGGNATITATLSAANGKDLLNPIVLTIPVSVYSHTHSYQAVVTAPTCTAQGYTTYTCACGDTYVSDYTAALGHSYESVTVDATCTTDGSVTYTCACGNTYTEVIPATGHSYTTVVTAPTCTEQGFTTYTCACGDSYVSDYTDALGHTYESVTVDATCTTDGSVTYTCTCGDTYTEVIPATGHTYTTVVTAPTCTEQGFTTYTCACGDTYVSDYTAALGHSNVSVVTAPTCTEGGYTTHTCTVCGNETVDSHVAALGHDYTAVVTAPTCVAGGYTTYTCGNCGDSYIADETPALGHSHETVTVDPTCTTDGSVTTTCTICGDSVTEIIPAIGHNYTAVVTAPTCTEGGFTTHTCGNCGDSYITDEIPALGHTYESITVDATCTTDGSVTYTCACGDTYTEVIPATGHTYITVVTAPTCETAGYTTHTCTVCGHSFEDGHVDALGHDYLSITVDPTCETAGHTAYTCRHCGDSHTGSYTAPLGHNYQSIVTAPTCTEGGFTTHTCANCGDSYITDEIPALDHAYESTVTAPTCETAGYTTHTCTVCGHSYTTDETAALGHTYESVTVDATCTTDGSVSYTCACGDSYVEVIPATGHDHDAVTTAPTCTEQGFTTYTCACSDSYVADYTDALGHTYESVTVDATCITDGSVVTTCTRCGDSHTNVIEALGHDYTAVVTAPTCTEGGYTTHTCGNCGDSYISDETAALGHTYESVTVDATCTTDGSVIHTCACGDSYVEVIPATGHAYESTVTAPTCTEGGYTTHTCGNCDDSYISDETAALGHSYESVTVDATCTADGSVTYTCACGDSYVEVIPATGHTYTTVVAAPTCTEQGYTTYTCTCGDSYVADYTDALGHTYESVTVDATCTENGSVTYTCACGDTYAEMIPATGHSYTCVESDGALIYTCDHCGDSYTEIINWVALPNIYTLDTDGIDIGANHKYLVVGSSKNYALTLNGTTIGSAAVTVDDNTITLDDPSGYEFYFVNNSSREGGSYLLTQDGSKYVYHMGGNMYYGNDNKGYWHIGNASNGSYQLFDYDNLSWYLNYGYVWGSNTVSRFAVSSTARSVRLFKLTEGYVRLSGSLNQTFTDADGATESSVLENLTIQTGTDGSTVSGTLAVTADMLTWNTAFDGTTPGTYTAAVTYQDLPLGTVTVTVTSKHTYETVVVAPTCTEGGCTVRTCTTCGVSYESGHTDALGHSYSCTESDGYLVYTCTRCGDGYSESISWITLANVYTLDTDGIDVGENHKYIVVGGSRDYALTRSGSSISATAVTVSNNTITLNNPTNFEFYFADNSSRESGSYLLTQDGSKSVYHVSGSVYYGHDSKGYWHIGSSSNGSYQLYDYDNLPWYLNYGYVWANNTTSRFAVSSTARSVRLFKAADGYVRLASSRALTFSSGVTEASVLENLTIQTSTDGSTVSGTVAVTAEMVTWNTAFDGNTAGTYTATVTYLGQTLGTVTVTIIT